MSLTAFTSAPLAMSSLHTGVNPFCAAMCSALLPLRGSEQLAWSGLVISAASSPRGLFHRIAEWIFFISSSERALGLTGFLCLPLSFSFSFSAFSSCSFSLRLASNSCLRFFSSASFLSLASLAFLSSSSLESEPR